jgi:hypothetical protein
VFDSTSSFNAFVDRQRQQKASWLLELAIGGNNREDRFFAGSPEVVVEV